MSTVLPATISAPASTSFIADATAIIQAFESGSISALEAAVLKMLTDYGFTIPASLQLTAKNASASFITIITDLAAFAAAAEAENVTGAWAAALKLLTDLGFTSV